MSVQFLLDADLSPRLAAIISECGHEALHTDALLPPRTPDRRVAEVARQTGRCLITGDFDFADLREFEPRDYLGIVVLTLPGKAGPGYIEALLREFLDRLPTLGDLRGKLLIIEPGRIRIRE